MKRIAFSEDILRDINYDHYIVQYEGDIEQELSQYPDYYLTIINDKYAMVSTKKDVEINVGEPYFSSIVYVKPTNMYTLQEISPIEASQVSFLQLELPLNLTGRDVNVAIIDSGIDYLNDEFINSNGETRIECIWDQTIISNSENQPIEVPYGSVYTKKQIQDAINAYREGKSPYEIVPSKDEIGHGTSMAGIIGATGKNPELKGVAPDCDFVVVKLIEDFSYAAQFKTQIPIFNITVIFSALQFLYEYALTSRKPMVIYFPLGTSLGNHKGNGILEEFIESIISTSGIALVAGTGNQRDTGGHASGIMLPRVPGQETQLGVMELEVSPEQEYLTVDIWIDYPNIMSLEILSPSGESTNIIQVIINETKPYKFIFEQTGIKVNYYFPEENTGDELIRVRFYKLQPGIWRLRLFPNYILNGKYNAWLPQKGIRVGSTRFSFADPFGTITNPSNSIKIITIAAYNQNNNNILSYSGMASRDVFVDRIDVAAGGVNALTVAPNNETAIVNGTSVASAVVAGVCALLFQWGIVDGNDPYIYSQTVKAYLAKGGVPRSGDISPNPYWGYGMLNVLKMFENMI